jgi:hypothetical protein
MTGLGNITQARARWRNWKDGHAHVIISLSKTQMPNPEKHLIPLFSYHSRSVHAHPLKLNGKR